MTDILPQFGGAAVMLVAFVVALSVIVAIHELGHLLVGRWTGIRAEVFLGNPKSFGAQMKYADRRRSPFAIIEGSD